MSEKLSELEPDYVSVIKDALEIKNTQDKIIKETMNLLKAQAMGIISKTFKKLTKLDNDLPEGVTRATINDTGDKLFLEFALSKKIIYKVLKIIDEETGVIIEGYNIGGPSTMIKFHAFVPLKILSKNGLDRV